MFFLLLLHFLPFFLLPYLLILCKKKMKMDLSGSGITEEIVRREMVKPPYTDPDAIEIWTITGEYYPYLLVVYSCVKDGILQEHRVDHGSHIDRDYRRRITADFLDVNRIYQGHKCTKPKKRKKEKETCQVCQAYIVWAIEQCKLMKRTDFPYPEKIKEMIEENFFDYGGDFPPYPNWDNVVKKIQEKKRIMKGENLNKEEKELYWRWLKYQPKMVDVEPGDVIETREMARNARRMLIAEWCRQRLASKEGK